MMVLLLNSFGSPEKKLSTNFSKANTKFCLSLHHNHDNSCLFVNGKEIVKFKACYKNVNFPTQLCLGSISNKFGAIDSREVSLKEIMYDFSVDCSAIDKPNMLNIHKYLMSKTNIRPYSGLSKKCLFGLLSFSGSLATLCMPLNN